MKTTEYDVNIYAPNDTTVKLIAYQWVTYPADEVNKLIHPGIEWTAGRGDEVAKTLTLTLKDNLPAIRYLFSILEDDEAFARIMDKHHESTLEEYDAWHGVWDDFAGDNAPHIIREWALSLPEYEDGMPEPDAKQHYYVVKYDEPSSEWGFGFEVQDERFGTMTTLNVTKNEWEDTESDYARSNAWHKNLGDLSDVFYSINKNTNK